MISILKHPTAWVPIALSLIMLATIFTWLAITGLPTQQPEDEGTGAHLFQIWLVLEVFMLGFFAMKWLPQNPKQAFMVLAIQITVVIAACAPVFILGL